MLCVPKSNKSLGNCIQILNKSFNLNLLEWKKWSFPYHYMKFLYRKKYYTQYFEHTSGMILKAMCALTNLMARCNSSHAHSHTYSSCPASERGWLSGGGGADFKWRWPARCAHVGPVAAAKQRERGGDCERDKVQLAGIQLSAAKVK